MQRWIALIRGINVGKAKRLPMAELRAMAAAVGGGNPRTHLQSGNLVFDSARPEAELKAALEKALHSFHDRPVAVLLVAAEAWAGLVAANPFPEQAAGEPNRLFLVIGPEPASESTLAALRDRATAGEQLVVAGGALWAFFPQGAGESKLTFGTATARNWRTVKAIEALIAA
jgi:uncharacterized protein (DUF1697 family)